MAVILAGGEGERLSILSSVRAKPAVPFGGKYRIADFVLSNFINSQIYSLYILVQYKSQSLIDHIRRPALLNHGGESALELLAAHVQVMRPRW